MLTSQPPIFQLSRSQLLSWVNSIALSHPSNPILTPITKIQQLGTGSIYCLLLQNLYPKNIPLNKVKFEAKSQYEYIFNFKILQQCFTKLKIMKMIEVEKLTKCKVQDNLQFLQWFKRMYDQKGLGFNNQINNINNNTQFNHHNTTHHNSTSSSHEVSISQNQLHLPIGQINIQKKQKQNKRPATVSSRTMLHNSNSIKDNNIINNNNNIINIEGKVNGMINGITNNGMIQGNEIKHTNFQKIEKLGQLAAQNHKRFNSLANINIQLQKNNKININNNNNENNQQQQQYQQHQPKEYIKKNIFSPSRNPFPKQQLYSPSKYSSSSIPSNILYEFYNNLPQISQQVLQKQSIKQYEQQKQFYMKKFKQIQHLLEYWNQERKSQQLVKQIRKILFIVKDNNNENKKWGINQKTGEVEFYQIKENINNNNNNNKNINFMQKKYNKDKKNNLFKQFNQTQQQQTQQLSNINNKINPNEQTQQPQNNKQTTGIQQRQQQQKNDIDNNNNHTDNHIDNQTVQTIS